MKKATAFCMAIILSLALFQSAFCVVPTRAEIVSGITETALPPLGENLVINGDFETDEDANGIPDGWTDSFFNKQGTTGPVGAMVVEGESAYGGSGRSILLRGGKNASYPFVQRGFKVEPKATYQVSLWVRKDNGTAAATAKLEFYAKGPTGSKCVQEGNTIQGLTKTNGWQRVLYNFVAPFTAQSVLIMPRLQSSDENECVYFDNIEVHMVAHPQIMEIKSDSIFYYPEQTEGEATASVRMDTFPEAFGGSVDFFFLDGETVCSSLENVPLNVEGKASFPYDTAFLKELKKEYKIRGVLKNDKGEELFRTEEPIYKFERPKYLGKDGVFRAKGEVFHPVVTYHVAQSQYDECAKAGINVVQGGIGDLAEAARNNLKVLVTLYGGMKSAGHPANAKKTEDIVNLYKEDERIFGWAIMDEPYLNLVDPLPELRESYRIIRELDDNHPVYICEASPQYFEDTAKNCDILCVDPYLPQANTSKPVMNTTHVYDYIQKGRQASNGMKPVISLLQAFKWYGYLPNGSAERHMIYQSFMAGATGHGYYEILNANKENGVEVPLYEVKETDIWEGIVSFGENEQADVYKHFAEKAYPGFSHVVNAESMYHGYIKDGKLYLIVMNQDATAEKTVTVPLTSFDEKVTLSGFSGRTIIGENSPTVNATSLSVQLAPYETALIEVTPQNEDFEWLFSETVQESFWAYFDTQNGITGIEEPMHFSDMAEYPWAIDAAEALLSAGVITETGAFDPGKPMTASGFADKLMAVLELSGSPAEVFGAVSDDALTKSTLLELVARGIHAKRGSRGEMLAPLPLGKLEKTVLVEEPIVLKTAEQLHLAVVKQGGEVQAYVSRAEAAYCLSFLISAKTCDFDAKTLFADHYNTLMESDSKVLYLSALLEQNTGVEGKVQKAEWTDGGRSFALYVNGTILSVENNTEKSSKAASLLSTTKDVNATYNGSRFYTSLPPNGIVFVEYNAKLEAGVYVGALRHCILPDSGHLRGAPLAAAYVKENEQWNFLRLYVGEERFEVTDGREYMIKCFRWSNWLVTDKKAVVVK